LFEVIEGYGFGIAKDGRDTPHDLKRIGGTEATLLGERN
jgi:hypothetical protein